MRKPLNTSVPEELIQRIDAYVKSSNGIYNNRSHLVEQAVKSYLGDHLSFAVGVSNPSSRRLDAPFSSSLYETSLFPRLAVNTQEKKAIAKSAANLIGTGKTVFIDDSTTCIELAKELSVQRKGLTIVSNSTLICLELGHHGEHKIIGVGGEYDSASASYVGSACQEELERYYVDYAFFSTKGFFPTEGTYESSMGTLQVKQTVARQSAHVVLLVDHTKFNQRSLCKVLDISQINTVITDEQSPNDVIDILLRKGIEVFVAPGFHENRVSKVED